MTIGKKTGGLLAAAVLVGAALWYLAAQYWIYLPGIIGEWRDPIGPNRPVVWEEGPAEADRPAGERAPNVILILADDLGFNDLTFAGGGLAGGSVPTPNIDSIARSGVTFANGYAGNATCAPSRAAIMTGRYATRFGYEFTPAPVPFHRLIASFNEDRDPPAFYHAEREAETPPVDDMGIPHSEVTVAELLQERGYHTLMLGKWHLGGAPGMRPDAHGFDEYLGFMPGAAMFLPKDHPDAVNSIQDFDPIDTFLWANLPYAIRFNGSGRFEPDGYMTDYLSAEAVKAIEANKNRPFFMYLAYNAPHTPLQATRADYDALSHIEDHTERVYAAMIRALDRGIGEVLGALKENGLEDNTLVIFTSDNGGAHYVGLPDLNRPYRGWKATFFEGGIHVPYFLKWPKVLPAGTQLAAPAAHIDIFSTVAAAAGAAPPKDRQIDGIDLAALVKGEPAPSRPLFWRSGDYMVLMDEGWKLQRSGTQDKVWLFNLNDDPTEQQDLSASEPEKLAEMTAKLDAINARQGKPLWPSLIEAPIAIDRPLNAPQVEGETFIYWSN